MIFNGRVIWYQPRDGNGVVETEDGRELSFVQAGGSLQGGDVVEFRVSGGNGRMVARDLRLVRHGIDDLLLNHAAAVELFHQMIEVPRA